MSEVPLCGVCQWWKGSGFRSPRARLSGVGRLRLADCTCADTCTPPSTPKSQNRAREHAPPSKFPRISPLRHYSINPHVHSCIPPQYPLCTQPRERLSGVGRRLLADSTCADTCAPQTSSFQHRQIWARSAGQTSFVPIASKKVRILRQFGGSWQDLIAASIYSKYSVGLSVRQVCTRYCLTMTNMIQACSNSH